MARRKYSQEYKQDAVLLVKAIKGVAIKWVGVI